MEKLDKASQLVDRAMKFEYWRFDEISREYHLKDLEKLLSSNPVLKAINSNLNGSLREPISAPKLTPNVLEAHRRQITF